MINIPKDTILDRQEIYKLCFDRYMFKTMFNECYQDNQETFKEILKKRTKKANIFAVQNTNEYFHNQEKIKEW